MSVIAELPQSSEFRAKEAIRSEPFFLLRRSLAHEGWPPEKVSAAIARYKKFLEVAVLLEDGYRPVPPDRDTEIVWRTHYEDRADYYVFLCDIVGRYVHVPWVVIAWESDITHMKDEWRSCHGEELAFDPPIRRRPFLLRWIPVIRW